jgi:NAD(P)-dependent dehydrogenase (short-subunit alcohol dehydrogenase family)
MTMGSTGEHVHGDRPPPPLERRRVVAVGGTSGMGLGAVRAALAAGAEVVAAGRRPPSARGASATEGGRLRDAVVDVTDDASVRALFDGVGQLDHLFVTATPPGGRGAFLEQDAAAAQAFMKGKFFGSWACAREAAPRMRSRRGAWARSRTSGTPRSSS